MVMGNILGNALQRFVFLDRCTVSAVFDAIVVA